MPTGFRSGSFSVTGPTSQTLFLGDSTSRFCVNAPNVRADNRPRLMIWKELA